MRFHPWVFSGAIYRMEGSPAEGDLVDVYTSERQFIARGHYQIGSITVRILSFVEEAIDQRWWNARIRAAYRMREALGLAENPQTTCYRLVHGEGDSLPGLVVDIYGRTAVIQCHSVGMYRSRKAIGEALREVFGDRLTALFDKSGGTLPYNAGLGAQDGYLWGEPAKTENPVLENGCLFRVNWEQGQKTAFSSTSARTANWSAAMQKARQYSTRSVTPGDFRSMPSPEEPAQVDSVDSSERAVQLAAENVALTSENRRRHRRDRARRVRVPARHGRPLRPDYSRPARVRKTPQGPRQRAARLQATQYASFPAD